MNNCPFCGAEVDTDPGSLYRYKCKSSNELRGRLCYKQEIAALQEKLEITETWRSDNLRQLKGTLNLKYELEKEIAALQKKVECLKDLHLEISALKERLEAWRALAPELDWKVYEDGAISYMISGKHLKRLKDLNEL